MPGILSNPSERIIMAARIPHWEVSSPRIFAESVGKLQLRASLLLGVWSIGDIVF